MNWGKPHHGYVPSASAVLHWAVDADGLQWGAAGVFI